MSSGPTSLTTTTTDTGTGTGAPSTSSSSSDTLELADPTATQVSTTGGFFTGTFPTQTFTQSVGDGSGNSNDNSGTGTTSSLYLFTFLATLLLLLAISCAIVIRSLVIRRRFQRRVQEALAEGYVFPPNSGPGSGIPPGAFGAFGAAGRRRFIDFGEKPKLWDAHIAPPPPPDRSKEMTWQNLMPVSVRVESDKLTGAGRQPPAAPSSTRPTFLGTASFGLVNGHNWRRPRFLSSRSSRSQPNNTGPSSDSPQPHGSGNADASQQESPQNQSPHHGDNTSTANNAVVEDAKLQVSVMIAMPSRYRPRVWQEGVHHPRGRGHGSRRPSRSHELAQRGFGAVDEEDEELPEIVLGTAEMPWKVSVPISRSESDSNNPNTNPSQQQGNTPTGGRGHTETTTPTSPSNR